jgi:hypothetical protein
MSLPERARRASRPAVLVLLGLTLGACGKSDLDEQGQVLSPPVTHSSAPSAQPGAVRVPLALSASRATRFANAVNLELADVIGASVEPRSSNPEEEKEAGKCGSGDSVPVGGGRSPKLDRGAGLEHEMISSSVVVMPDEHAARADFSYASSKAGLQCYANVLGKSLTNQAGAGVRVGRVRLRRMQLQGPEATPSTGIRISARVSAAAGGLSVPLYIDAVGFIYGPAEIEIYATSFVQPEPQHTEQQLLTLLDQRARLHRL